MEAENSPFKIQTLTMRNLHDWKENIQLNISYRELDELLLYSYSASEDADAKLVCKEKDEKAMDIIAHS